MLRHLYGHSYKRRGQPHAPASMAQLARKGRLRPETVAEMVRSGKLHSGVVAELRAAGTYPKWCLKLTGGVDETVSSVRAGGAEGKNRTKTIPPYGDRRRMADYRVVRSGFTLRPWQIVIGNGRGLSVYASYKYQDHAIAAAVALNHGRAPKVLDTFADSRWERE